MDSAKPNGPIYKIHECQAFSTLWHLQRQIVDIISKLGNVKPPLDIHVGYILSKKSFALFFRKEWKDPKEVGEYYKISVTTITET